MELPTLTTARLSLRPFSRADLPALFEILADEEANRFLPWFPVRTMGEAEAFYRQRHEASADLHFAVCPKPEGAPIGYVKLSPEPPYDLGYGLRSACWGRGIASEAVAAALDWARRAAFAPYVTATHDVNNPRSGGVMRRVGMRYAYSYREQWQPKDVSVVFRLYQLSLDGRERPAYPGYWERYPEHFVEQGL